MSLERAIQDSILIREEYNRETVDTLLNFWEGRDPHVINLESFLKSYSLSKKASRRGEFENYYLRYHAAEFDAAGHMSRPKTKFESGSIGEGDYVIVLSYSDVNNPLVESVDLATISFSVIEDGIMIKQIQGLVNHEETGEFYTKKLTQLRWDEALLQYCVNLTKDLGGKKAEVLGSRNQYWLKLTYDSLDDNYPGKYSYEDFLEMSDYEVLELLEHNEYEDIHLLPQQAKKRYDKLPMSIGFEPIHTKDGEGNYRLKLS